MVERWPMSEAAATSTARMAMVMVTRARAASWAPCSACSANSLGSSGIGILLEMRIVLEMPGCARKDSKKSRRRAARRAFPSLGELR